MKNETKKEMQARIRKLERELGSAKSHVDNLVESVVTVTNTNDRLMDKSSEREAKEHVRGSEFHALKTVQPDYSEILAGRAFDTRENDRDFRVGDTILFREFDSRHQEYTGEQTKRQITSVMTTDDRYGALNPDFVLLGLS